MVTVPFLLTTNVYTPASRETPARAQSASVIFLCQTPSSFAGTADARVVAASTVPSGHAIASANATTAQWVVLRADTRTPLTANLHCAGGHRRRRRVSGRAGRAEARNTSGASQHDPRGRARSRRGDLVRCACLPGGR